MKHVCDWVDFTTCVKKAGQVYEMRVSDFKDYQSGLTQSKESKRTRPLLENVSAVEFRKGSTDLHFKTSHSENEFKTAVFFKKTTRVSIKNNTLDVKGRDIARGINKIKKEHIIEKLGHLMEPYHLRFFEELVTSDDVPDLMDTR